MYKPTRDAVRLLHGNQSTVPVVREVPHIWKAVVIVVGREVLLEQQPPPVRIECTLY